MDGFYLAKMDLFNTIKKWIDWFYGAKMCMAGFNMVNKGIDRFYISNKVIDEFYIASSCVVVFKQP